jgi:hypothetical protein
MARSASRTTTVRYVKNAEKGARPLGPLRWSDVATGFKFLSGAAGETCYHIVLYNDTFYQCIATHNKTANNYPGSTAGANVWSKVDDYECVATAILLAKYALVENLGVGAIEMYKNGTRVFYAKDGTVECNAGTFNNVTVTGELKANTLDLQRNGSFYFNPNKVTLPHLDDGFSREIFVLKSQTKQDFVLATTLVPATNAYICTSSSVYDEDARVSSMTLGFGLWRIHGYRYGDKTFWFVEKIDVYNPSPTT